MANGKIRFGKQSGGQLALVIPDGVANTEVVIPESGTLVSVGTTVTDNTVPRFDGTTGQVQNSSVVIDDSGNLLIGTSTDNGVDKLQVNGSISSGTIIVFDSGDLNNFKYITQNVGTVPTMLNVPIYDHGYLEVIVYSGNVWVLQRFTCLGAVNIAYAGRTFVRCFTRGTTWTPWVEK